MRSPAPRPYGGALQSAISVLVRDALSVGVNAKLPTNQQYLLDHNIGAGTLQRALRELHKRQALSTVSRGHLGLYVTELDIASAWRAGDLDAVRLVLPPAGPVEITALQTEVAQAFSILGIPHTVKHLRGGSIRLGLLEDGEADMAVVSAGALASSSYPFKSRALGVGTYYGPQRIKVVKRSDDRGKPAVIAIDQESPDHQALTYAEFPPDHGYTFVNIAFPHITCAVLDRRADAGVWHCTPSVIPLDLAGLNLTNLETPAGLSAWEQTSEAVLVISLARPELNVVIDELDLTDLAAHQAQAIAQDDGLVPVL